ncbi:hypothetical protein AHAS_Ahas19G0181900 [Arachis hypogaea]
MPPLATIEARCRRVALVYRAATVVQGRPPLLLCPLTAPLHEPEELVPAGASAAIRATLEAIDLVPIPPFLRL